MKFFLKYPYFIIGTLFFILGAAFKFYFIHDYELQGDEAFSVFHAQQTVSELIATLNTEANPPFYYLLLHFWIKLVGISPEWVKSLTLLLSLGTTTFLVLIGKRLKGLIFSIFVSTAFLCSNLYFEFSHEIRAFQLVLLLTAASVYFFLSYLETRHWKFWIGIVFTTFTLPFTHYNAALVVIVQGLATLLLIRKQWSLVWKIWLGYALAGLAFLPQFFIFRSVVPDTSFWLGLSKWDDFLYIAQTATGYQGKFIYLWIAYGLSPILVLIGYKKGIFTRTFRWEYFFYFFMLYILPLVLNFLLAQYTPSFQLRYVLFTGFGILFSLGYVLANLRRPPLVGLVVLLGFMTLFILEFRPGKKDNEGWKDSAAFIQQMRKSEKVGVVITASYKLKDLVYYLDRNAFADYIHLYENAQRIDVFGLKDTLDMSYMGDLKRFDKLIYLRSNAQFEDEANSITQFFDHHFTKCYVIGDPAHSIISVYNVGGNPCFSWKALGRFDEENKGLTWHVTDFIDELSGKHKFEYDYLQEVQGPFNMEGKDFSPGIFLPAAGISMVSASFEFESKESPSAILVISVEANGKAEKRIEFPLAKFYSGVHDKAEVQVGLPFTSSEGAELKVYFYNPNKEQLVLTDYQITVWK
jgi:Dolichyl-phosphate-mannose-protein mannosyltransferase